MSTFHVVPVHQTNDGARTLGVVAKGSLETELTALREELEAFKTQSPERPSILHRRLEAFEQLRSRAQLYRDILHVQVEDLEQHLTFHGDLRPGTAGRPGGRMTPTNVNPTLAALLALRADLVSRFPEREAVVDGALCALLAGEHVLLLGPPGTAKSALVRALAQSVRGRYFEQLLTNFYTP